MKDCTVCIYAETDYFEYYGNAREYFVCDCKKGKDIEAEDCDEFKEYIEERKE